jgi:hypothetical protein
MAVATITSYLLKLDVLANNPSSFTDPVAIVQDLSNFCFGEINKNELGFYLQNIIK